MSSKADEAKKSSEGGAWEIIRVVIQALLIAFVVRTFLYQPFNIPSGSMIPTLLIGDYLFVSKLSYGYSQYTFSFSIGSGESRLFRFKPFPFSGRIFASNPERGDVAVFKLPSDNETDYIKRVIGLPGDKVQMIDGVVHINGVAAKQEKIGSFLDTTSGGLPARVTVYNETLPNGVVHKIYDQGPTYFDNTRVFEVPADHYFMMGDNRDNSTDSRFAAVGYVPFENFVGRADLLFYSQEPGAAFWQFWRWPTSVRWGRLFNIVD